ncbi:cytochrome c peroxidase [Marinoscillum furvescens DSM 4134]|uniref:Cytochrome c peroxidase n=2 Tax=Marinoscillum furvescens TaxID=1026 RepID=A0A3D9L7Z0_MARFU|nr:cytochrome c peroxidase [Marinoscillum furvescens DSM 4134]
MTVGLFFAFSCVERSQQPVTPDAYYHEKLDEMASQMLIVQNAPTLDEKRKAYKASRSAFKAIEPMLAFVDIENYETLNQPNLLQVEEEDLTNIRIKAPEGFQVIEELLFASRPDTALIARKANFVIQRAGLINKNTSLEALKPHHVLWAIRNSIVGTALTGLSGFDSPMLINSLNDATEVYQTLSFWLDSQKNRFSDPALHHSWQKELQKTIETLKKGEFDTFDRLEFIKNHTHLQLRLWNQTVADWNVSFPFSLALSNDADNLFEAESYNLKYFSDPNGPAPTPELLSLGKRLFYDQKLSANGKMSCGSCHQPKLAFTDGKKKSIGNQGQELLRNAPTLLYAGFQKGFFYDKRSNSLEAQITQVVNDENEFHSDLQTLQASITKDTTYRQQFFKAFKTTTIVEAQVRQAIASYIRSLAPFSSKLDRHFQSENEVLNEQEKLGFNLFMGKAACATCHFPPFFNGTVPPRWKDSELENLGVPATAENKKIDTDPGRFSLFHTEEKRFFFKTPTIRNVALTAPYMHNGVYDSLEQVMDFYNAGGGEGMGLQVPHQTLPPDSLGLDQEEIDAIIAFMHALNDDVAAVAAY